MKQTRDVIVELLRHVSGRKEVGQYLTQYCSVDSQKFAVIKIGGAILHEERDVVASALSFLHKVGLYPVVVHGAGPQLDAALEDAGIDAPIIDGLRVTSPEAIEVVRRVLQRENLALVEALATHGTAARPITSGVFEAKLRDRDRYGLVGDVRGVDEAAIAAAIRAEQLPILTSLATSGDGQLLNVNADEGARALALRIEPHKIIFLTATGGLLDAQSKVVSAVNMSEDYEPLLRAGWLSGGMRLKLEQIHALLQQLPSSSSVSITSPSHLARELFTHRGAGTLLRRGERVLSYEGFNDIDTQRLRGLLESCFGRKLDEDYFETRHCHRLYVTEQYRATAVITREGGLPYLDKFAVTTKAQGEGLGGSVWSRVRRDHGKLFWRAQSNNEVNGWYFQQADGTHRSDGWTVFWYGMRDFEEIERCVAIALAKPPSLRAHGTSA